MIFTCTCYLIYFQNTKSNWALINLYVDANQLLWTIGIIVGSLINIKSVFLLTVYCGCYCFSNLGKSFALRRKMGENMRALLWIESLVKIIS